MSTSDINILLQDARTLQKINHITSPEVRAKILSSNTQKIFVTLTDLIHPNNPSFDFVSMKQAYKFSKNYGNGRVVSLNKFAYYNKLKVHQYEVNHWRVVVSKSN
jgi:hypothetical protein